MIDVQKISIGKVRRAYALDDHDTDALLAALWPQGVFPWELWQKIYAKFWRGSADSNAVLYRVEAPAFPGSTAAKEKYFFPHIYAREAATVFKKLASTIDADAIRLGLGELLAITYEDSSDVPVQDEIDSLLGKLTEIEKNSSYQFPVADSHGFTSLMEEKILTLPPGDYHFIAGLFAATVIVDKPAAIRHLDSINYPLREEVKGITHGLVQSILGQPSQEKPADQEPAAETQSHEQKETVPVPTALWKGKTPEAICAAMRLENYADAVIAHVLYVKRRFQNKTEIGRMLDPSDKELSTYRKKTDRLLAEASRMDIIDI